MSAWLVQDRPRASLVRGGLSAVHKFCTEQAALASISCDSGICHARKAPHAGAHVAARSICGRRVKRTGDVRRCMWRDRRIYPAVTRSVTSRLPAKRKKFYRKVRLRAPQRREWAQGAPPLPSAIAFAGDESSPYVQEAAPRRLRSNSADAAAQVLVEAAREEARHDLELRVHGRRKMASHPAGRSRAR
jgi:hypothetical protein